MKEKSPEGCYSAGAYIKENENTKNRQTNQAHNNVPEH